MTAAQRKGISRLTIAAVVLCGMLTASSAASAVPDGGIPALIRPGADLAAHTPGPETAWVDSIFIAGWVHGGGHEFGVLVHTLTFPNAGQQKLFVSISDTTTGWYRNYEAEIPNDQFSWSTTGLDIAMPGLTWTGTKLQMRVKATTPWGSLNARLKNDGPVFSYSGIGLIKLIDDPNYEYAFPATKTTGTLTTQGKDRPVSGVSWFDRQWGPLPVEDPTMRWTWMNPTLSNGDQLAVWDVRNNATENSWVTVQRPDGSYQVARVRPLARDAHRFWNSPATGKTYPTRWRVRVPALRAHLNVVVTGRKGQEFPDGHVEDTADVAGKVQGRKVTGKTFVEMTGNFTAPRARR